MQALNYIFTVYIFALQIRYIMMMMERFACMYTYFVHNWLQYYILSTKNPNDLFR
jgi:hypothetical protein